MEAVTERRMPTLTAGEQDRLSSGRATRPVYLSAGQGIAWLRCGLTAWSITLPSPPEGIERSMRLAPWQAWRRSKTKRERDVGRLLELDPRLGHLVCTEVCVIGLVHWWFPAHEND